MIYPWLIGLVRYEQTQPMEIHSGLPDQETFESVSRYVINATALYTANVKFFVETLVLPDIKYEANLYVGLDFAF